jgi:hypothetical protein
VGKNHLFDDDGVWLEGKDGLPRVPNRPVGQDLLGFRVGLRLGLRMIWRGFAYAPPLLLASFHRHNDNDNDNDNDNENENDGDGYGALWLIRVVESFRRGTRLVLREEDEIYIPLRAETYLLIFTSIRWGT